MIKYWKNLLSHKAEHHLIKINGSLVEKKDTVQYVYSPVLDDILSILYVLFRNTVTDTVELRQHRTTDK